MIVILFSHDAHYVDMLAFISLYLTRIRLVLDFYDVCAWAVLCLGLDGIVHDLFTFASAGVRLSQVKFFLSRDSLRGAYPVSQCLHM